MKKPAGFGPNQARALSSLSFIYYGPRIEPGPTGSGLGPFQLYNDLKLTTSIYL